MKRPQLARQPNKLLVSWSGVFVLSAFLAAQGIAPSAAAQAAAPSPTAAEPTPGSEPKQPVLPSELLPPRLPLAEGAQTEPEATSLPAVSARPPLAAPADSGGPSHAPAPIPTAELPPVPPEPGAPGVDRLLHEFMATGARLAGRPGGTAQVHFPGSPEQPNWFQVLRATSEDDPLLEDACRKQALRFSVASLAASKGVADESQALQVAAEHMRRHLEFIRAGGVISYADYFKSIAECRAFCGPLVAHLIQCHTLAVSKRTHGLVLFALDSDRVDPRYDAGILEQLEQQLKSDPARHVLLIGRASFVGDLLYNRRLSAKRALAVKDRLVAQGTRRDQVETLWLGWEPPQITPDIAQRYGLREQYQEEGSQRMNQSVVAVLH